MRTEQLAIPAALAARFDWKSFATCQATAMWLHGIRLEALEGDDGAPLFVATLHAMTRTFRTIPEIAGWLHALDQEEAPRGEMARFAEARGVPA
jgi:hypothetical protein